MCFQLYPNLSIISYWQPLQQWGCCVVHGSVTLLCILQVHFWTIVFNVCQVVGYSISAFVMTVVPLVKVLPCHPVVSTYYRPFPNPARLMLYNMWCLSSLSFFQRMQYVSFWHTVSILFLFDWRSNANIFWVISVTWRQKYLEQLMWYHSLGTNACSVCKQSHPIFFSCLGRSLLYLL